MPFLEDTVDLVAFVVENTDVFLEETDWVALGPEV